MTKQYHIHHATGVNKFTEVEVQQREYAGCVEAESLQEAYTRSQNLEDPWNMVYPCRSTSVGDVIQDGFDFYMVCGVGFRLLVGDAEPEATEESLSDQETQEVDMLIARNTMDREKFTLHGDMANEFNDSQSEDERDEDY